MFKWFKRFKKKHPPPRDIVIHHSFFRGWPKSPSIQLQTFPLSIRISLAPRPTSLPIQCIEYLYYESDSITGIKRATYILTDKDFHKNVPDFIWVFLI